MPGQPTRAHTRSGMSRRLPLALPQFIQQAQEALTFSLSTLCGTPGVVRNRKTSSACAEAVHYADYLWKGTEKAGLNLCSRQRLKPGMPRHHKRHGAGLLLLTPLGILDSASDSHSRITLLRPGGRGVELVSHSIHECAELTRTRRMAQFP